MTGRDEGERGRRKGKRDGIRRKMKGGKVVRT